MTKHAVRNLAVCCGAILRHIEKPQYRCTTTVHHAYNGSKKVLENLLPVWLLVLTILFISSRFLDYLYELWQLLSALYSDVRKKYIDAHTFSVINNSTAVEFYSNLLASYTKWCAQTFPLIFFRLFAIFDSNFGKIVAPPSDGNENCIVHLKWSG